MSRKQHLLSTLSYVSRLEGTEKKRAEQRGRKTPTKEKKLPHFSTHGFRGLHIQEENTVRGI